MEEEEFAMLLVPPLDHDQLEIPPHDADLAEKRRKKFMLQSEDSTQNGFGFIKKWLSKMFSDQLYKACKLGNTLQVR